MVDQQRAADRRRAALIADQEVTRQAQAQAVAAEGLGIDEAQPSTQAVAGLLNGQARDAATSALAVAAQVAAGSSYDAARPAALAAHDPGLLYVDGPSTAPSVVSVYNGAAGWAAAVHGAGDTCYWVAVTTRGRHALRHRLGLHRDGRARGRPPCLVADRPIRPFSRSVLRCSVTAEPSPEEGWP